MIVRMLVHQNMVAATVAAAMTEAARAWAPVVAGALAADGADGGVGTEIEANALALALSLKLFEAAAILQSALDPSVCSGNKETWNPGASFVPVAVTQTNGLPLAMVVSDD